MTEIGVTLREARMRAGIDIAEVESRTKIRAKYLRALENEEWNLLPGTTFVKSFLRTYAEMLGLDGKLLVEEYKFRHEPYENGTGGGVVPRHQTGGRRGRRGGGAFGPPKRTNWLPILVLIVVVLGALFAVYTTSKNEDEPPVAAPPVTTKDDQAAKEAAATKRRRAQQRKAKAERQLVKLRITADPGATQVYVCVVDATGAKVINGQQLQPGKRTKLLRSKRFRIALNSDAVQVTDGGKALPLSAVNGVVSYTLTKDQRVRLSPTQRPSCAT